MRFSSFIRIALLCCATLVAGCESASTPAADPAGSVVLPGTPAGASNGAPDAPAAAQTGAAGGAGDAEGPGGAADAGAEASGAEGRDGGVTLPAGDVDTEPPQAPHPAPVAVGCVTDVSAGRQDAVPCAGITHILTVPEACLTRACGLIVDVHGGTMTAQMQIDNTEIDRIGSERGYVVLHPNAVAGLWAADVDDDRILEMMDDLIAAFHIDEKRVHITGFSQGGYMTWRFLCKHAERIASAAPASAAEMGAILLPEVGCAFTGSEATDDEVDILFMFGTMDALVIPATGETQRDLVIAHYGMQLDTRVLDDPSVRWDRYVNATGMVFEFIHHDYITDGAIVLPLQGHCYPGSGDPLFGCNPPTALHWGEAVVDFFERHPRP